MLIRWFKENAFKKRGKIIAKKKDSEENLTGWLLILSVHPESDGTK